MLRIAERKRPSPSREGDQPPLLVDIFTQASPQAFAKVPSTPSLLFV
jgi:hypothetical protein